MQNATPEFLLTQAYLRKHPTASIQSIYNFVNITNPNLTPSKFYTMIYHWLRRKEIKRVNHGIYQLVANPASKKPSIHSPKTQSNTSAYIAKQVELADTHFRQEEADDDRITQDAPSHKLAIRIGDYDLVLNLSVKVNVE